MKKTLTAWATIVSFCLVSSCGHYYGFGIRSDSPSLKFKQTEKSNICGKYEFETVLFRADDNSFQIILQHPIYPLATPDILISQVGIISEGSTPADFRFIKIEIHHFDESGKTISPSETITIPASGKMDFHVVKYERDTFPKKKVREEVNVEFSSQGKTHSISFDEDVFWVKRVGKLSAGMSI